MTGIQLGNEFLDMPPGAIMQRERNSPFWLTTTGDGKDGIPGETSSPFDFPLTPANRRRLGFAGTIPVLRQRMFDVRLVDEVCQMSAGRMVMLKTKVNRNNPDAGTQEAYMLHNSSHFFKSIEGKKLRDLSLGGERVWDWDGYTYTGTGFWAHVHATLEQQSCDDGDYVFFPVDNPEYKGYADMVNRMCIKDKDDEVYRMDEANTESSLATSLCPHIYIHYIIRCIFEEHGYKVSGDILNDPGFKQICLISLQSVYWSETSLDGEFVPSRPLDTVSIRLGQHLPPDETIAEFLVALCTFLPLGLEIDDNYRTCTIRTLGRPPKSVKDWTYKVQAMAELPQPDSGKEVKKMGIDRQFSDGNPFQTFDSKAYNIEHEDFDCTYELARNAWFGYNDSWGAGRNPDLGSNINSYQPEGATDSISSKMTPLPDRDAVLKSYDPGGFADGILRMPYMEMEGNWAGKAVTTGWGLRVAFYRGIVTQTTIFAGNAYTINFPVATHHNRIVFIDRVWPWTMAFDNGTTEDMLSKWWAPWLKVLEEEDGFNGVCHLPLLEYIKFKWGDIIQIESTNFLVRKIVDVFPYPGWFQFEAVRIKP